MSWGGFKETVRKEAQPDFSHVRLCDAGDLLNAILATYEHLSEEVAAELPLKRVWALTLAEAER